MIALIEVAMGALLRPGDKADIQKEYKIDGHSKGQRELRAATLTILLYALKTYSSICIFLIIYTCI
jgi:hypothetical protein